MTGAEGIDVAWRLPSGSGAVVRGVWRAVGGLWAGDGAGCAPGAYRGENRDREWFVPEQTPESEGSVCRNIKTLFHFDPPVTDEEIGAASLQFVRKISGFNKPSKANEAAFHAAVEEVAAASARLLASLETTGPARNREEEAAKARARGMARFGA
jgi:hypothetical protein